MPNNNNITAISNEQSTHTIKRKIGSTIYNVSISFSQTGKEDMNDKIMRLIKNDTETPRAVGQ